jgi:hypothetical protein
MACKSGFGDVLWPKVHRQMLYAQNLNCRQVENGLHSTYAMSRQRAITKCNDARQWNGRIAVKRPSPAMKLSASCYDHAPQGGSPRISKSWGFNKNGEGFLSSQCLTIYQCGLLVVGSGGKSSALGLLDGAAKSKMGAERDNHRDTVSWKPSHWVIMCHVTART